MADTKTRGKPQEGQEPEPQEPEEGQEGEQIQPEGMTAYREQLSLDVGGSRAPDVGEVKITGGSVPLKGEFELGDEVPMLVWGRVGKIEVVETRDNAGNVTKVVRRHIVGLEHVERYEAPSEGPPAE